MSVRELMQDALYMGSMAGSRVVAGWSRTSVSRRRVFLLVVLLIVLLAWLGPRIGIVGKGTGGLTDDELKLIERLGNGTGNTERLPPWYEEPINRGRSDNDD